MALGSWPSATAPSTAGPTTIHANSSQAEPLAITDSTAARYTLADPDVRLMLMVRDDDARAFEELMLRYQNRLVSLLAHMTGQPDLAEDLAQDVFLRVYRARKRYVPGAKFSTWLFTIAGNVAANAQRSRSRRHEVHLPPSTNDTTSMPIDSLAVAASGLMPTRQLDKAELPRCGAAGDRRARRAAADGGAALEVRTLELRRDRRSDGPHARGGEVAAVAGADAAARSAGTLFRTRVGRSRHHIIPDSRLLTPDSFPTCRRPHPNLMHRIPTSWWRISTASCRPTNAGASSGGWRATRTIAGGSPSWSRPGRRSRRCRRRWRATTSRGRRSRWSRWRRSATWRRRGRVDQAAGRRQSWMAVAGGLAIGDGGVCGGADVGAEPERAAGGESAGGRAARRADAGGRHRILARTDETRHRRRSAAAKQRPALRRRSNEWQTLEDRRRWIEALAGREKAELAAKFDRFERLTPRRRHKNGCCARPRDRRSA